MATSNKTDKTSAAADDDAVTTTKTTTTKTITVADNLISQVAYNLICPITLELPVDPVTAEDGRVYEREAIEEYFEGAGDVKSPCTNKPMGKKLLPATQHRNTIETLIESGIITGDLANSWKEQSAGKKKAKKIVHNLVLEKKEMVSPEDVKFAKDWYDKDWKANRIRGAAAFAAITIYQYGFSIVDDVDEHNLKHPDIVTLYLRHLESFAVSGSTLAAYIMGFVYAEGKFGYPVEKLIACSLLKEEVVNTDAWDLPGGYSEYLPTAQAKVKELKKELKKKKKKKGGSRRPPTSTIFEGPPIPPMVVDEGPSEEADDGYMDWLQPIEDPSGFRGGGR